MRNARHVSGRLIELRGPGRSNRKAGAHLRFDDELSRAGQQFDVPPPVTHSEVAYDAVGVREAFTPQVAAPPWPKPAPKQRLGELAAIFSERQFADRNTVPGGPIERGQQG